MKIVELFIFLCVVAVYYLTIKRSNRLLKKKLNKIEVENAIVLSKIRNMDKRYLDIQRNLLVVSHICEMCNRTIQQEVGIKMDSKLESLQNLCIELEMSIQDFKEGNVNTIVVNSEEVAKKLFNDIYDNPDYMNIIKEIFMPQEESNK